MAAGCPATYGQAKHRTFWLDLVRHLVGLAFLWRGTWVYGGNIEEYVKGLLPCWFSIWRRKHVIKHVIKLEHKPEHGSGTNPEHHKN